MPQDAHRQHVRRGSSKLRLGDPSAFFALESREGGRCLMSKSKSADGLSLVLRASWGPKPRIGILLDQKVSPSTVVEARYLV